MNKLTHSELSAVFINCSIGKEKSKSHTQKLIDKVTKIMKDEGVKVSDVYARDFQIPTGMIKDGAEQGELDDWPSIQKQVEAADILVIATPIWLGDKSSIATKVLRIFLYLLLYFCVFPCAFMVTLCLNGTHCHRKCRYTGNFLIAVMQHEVVTVSRVG